MKHRKLKVAWAYIVEIVLAILLVGLGCSTMGAAALAELVRQFALDIATLYCAVFFAAALGFLWTFYSKADTEFYTWLDRIGSFHVFLNATAYVVAIEGVAIFLLLATKLFTGNGFALLAAFGFLLALINSYTMVKNVIDLMKLHTFFNRVSREDRKVSP
ncbi:hypothetical protein [Quatrionicoccus australiensis]|uniref:hypothetical protein n=1 Tax=Quatrionicoccus australiensis TaxID=138118 RepID=UPI001CF90FF8|nr:hypothetical protein [Quatrionicoccus australiensis]UCV13674.1 hypothetical protein KI612_11975 [Quatrionicoccus australiensis]